MITAVYKPKGPTSHDIVDAVRRITGERRVGHAGTLDPMAEGVLVIGIGREATKRLTEAVAGEKEYVAVIRLGATSDTDDAEGVLTETPDVIPVLRADLEHALPQFIGTIQQVPPRYSAVKIKGKPAHRRVRGGEDVQLSPRSVIIRTLTLACYAWPEVTLHVTCGPGTYIRSIARDLGAALGVGGLLTALQRTRVGTYTLAHAQTLAEFERDWKRAHP